MSEYLNKDQIKKQIRNDFAYFDGLLDDLAINFRKWSKAQGFRSGWDLVPEKLMLIVTELGEAMQEYRKSDFKIDDQTSQSFLKFREELADVFIRLLDLAGELQISLEKEALRKMEINFRRPPKHGKRI